MRFSYSAEHRVFQKLYGSWKLETNQENIQIVMQFLMKNQFLLFNALYKELYLNSEKSIKKAVLPAICEFSKNGKYLRLKYIHLNDSEMYTFEFTSKNSFKICSFDLGREYEFFRTD